MISCNRVGDDSSGRSKLRVAIITPFYLQTTRGNAVTVRRIEMYLQKLGCDTAVFSLDMQSPASMSAAVRSFSPELIHAFHGIHSGSIAKDMADKINVPFVITMTGTDIFTESESARERLEAAKSAAAFVFFAQEIQDHFKAQHPDLAVSTVLIPQGVVLPENINEKPFSVNSFIFLLPAGIRPVKNLLFPFAPLAELSRRYPQVILVIAGPAIDADYTSQLLAAVAANPFSSWVGEVAHVDMPALYSSAQVVLNTSLSEGGMANSILEGMAFGRPVLVSDVAGNRSLVKDSVNGFLYADEADFLRKAEKLLTDKNLRSLMGSNGREYVASHCTPDLEAQRYLELYEACVKSTSL